MDSVVSMARVSPSSLFRNGAWRIFGPPKMGDPRFYTDTVKIGNLK